jgi:glc operon protein GlcG
MSPSQDHVHSSPSVSLAGARALIDAALAHAEQLGVQIVVTVLDRAGHPVASARMDGAPLGSIGVAHDKGWTVTAFGHPSQWWAETFAADPSLVVLGEGRPLLGVPGGVPLIVDGTLVGAIAVSGATSEEDVQIAQAAVELLT